VTCTCPARDCSALRHTFIDEDGETRQSNMSQADIDRIAAAVGAMSQAKVTTVVYSDAFSTETPQHRADRIKRAIAGKR